jgi:hypothetical protein
MGAALVGLTGLFTLVLGAAFSSACIGYLSFAPILPAALSIDLGSNAPLLSLHRLLTGALVAIFAVRQALSRRLPQRSWLLFPLALVFISYLLSIAFSSNPNPAGIFRAFSFSFEEAAVFVIAASVLGKEDRVYGLLVGLSLALVCTEVYAGLELLLHRNILAELAPAYREGLIFDYTLESRFGLPRLQSVFRNPLDFGVFLQLSLPLTLVLARSAKHQRHIVLAVSAFILGCPIAILTGSRMVLYSLGLTLAAYIILKRQWKLAMGIGAVAALTVALIQRLSGFRVIDYLLLSATRPELYALDVNGSSLDSLARVSAEHIRMLLERPFTGWGPATLPPNSAGEGLDSYWTGFGEQGITYAGVELGLLGLGGFMLLFLATLRRCRWAELRARSPLGARIGTSLFCITIGYLVSMQLEGAWHFPLYLSCIAIVWTDSDLYPRSWPVTNDAT